MSSYYVINVIAVLSVLSVAICDVTSELSLDTSDDKAEFDARHHDHLSSNSDKLPNVNSFIKGVEVVIRDFCMDAGSYSNACLELGELQRRAADLSWKVAELKLGILQGLTAATSRGEVGHEEAKRSRPALSVDAPLRSVSEKVHRHQVRMSMELLRKLGRKR